jgi:hypothetical protein
MHSNGKSTKLMAIGYPHNGSVRHCFMQSMVRFREFDLGNGNILGAQIPRHGMYIAGQRNAIVSDFLTTGLEWLLMIDTDQIFDPEIPYLLLQSAEDANALVMSALYFGILQGKYAPMWWQRKADGTFHTAAVIQENCIQEIQGFGAGMVPMHRSIFEDMAPRYPDDPWKWFGHDLTMFCGELERYGEDLCFCNRLHDMGVKMYGDSRLIIGHEKTVNLDFKLFMKLAEHLKEGEEPKENIIRPIV